jgi:FixJ family two-component response regulator
MKKQPPPKTDIPRVTTVLSVSPLAEDYVSLQAFLDHSKWELHKSDSVVSALAVIRRWDVSVVICEQDLSPGSWIDMQAELSLLRIVPPLIVTSRLADEKLWVEVLNLGAYDVLAKPFERAELVRTVLGAVALAPTTGVSAKVVNAVRTAS